MKEDETLVGKLVSVFKGHFMQWLALGILVFAMGAASKRALVSLVVPVVKVIWPFLVIWLVYRFIRGRVAGAVKKFQEQMMANIQQQQGQAAGARSGGQVLDLCTKCGSLDSAGHRCP